MAASAHRRELVKALVVGALVAGFLTVPSATGQLPVAQADGTVSGAFALGGGMAGSVDQRTGQFSVSIPLVHVTSRGDSGIDLTLSWEQSRAGAGLDRAGWGGGWSLGTTFIETTGAVTVYPANGGSYQADTTGSYPSGLRYYTQADIVFASTGGTLPGRNVTGGDSIADQTYGYTISYDDGKIDYYDPNGNLIARADRFGNRTDLAYTSPADDQFQPTSITDAYGLVTSFDYNSQPGAVVVSAPTRSDQVQSKTTVVFGDDGEVESVLDPAGNRASFDYTDQQVDGTTQHLLDTATGPAGATTSVGYDAVDYASGPTVVIAKTLAVADAGGKQISPTRTFDINPDPPGIDNDFHNYLGYPNYLSAAGNDELFESADDSYTYTTEISTPAAATVSTYDSAHRLISRMVQGTDGDGNYITATTQSAEFPQLQPVGFQPANYARPTGSSVNYDSRNGPNGYANAAGGGRTVTTSTKYDDHGRIQQATDETGAVTKYSYDATFGLPTATVVIGKDGTTRSTTNTLSDDKSTIKTSTVAVGDSATTAAARSVSTYQFDQFGEPSSRSVAWAVDAAPADNGGGPEAATTTYASVIDPAAATRKLTITKADDTAAESHTTTTIDLVGSQVVAYADELGRVSNWTYDAAGRVTKAAPATGLETTTSYQQATGSAPAGKLVTTADGHQVQTSYDPLGRVVLITDNVHDGAFNSDRTTRTVAKYSYTANQVTTSAGTLGTTMTATDLAGRVTTTVTDGLGKTVLETAANGVTKSTSYDDVANTVTRQTRGEGAAQAAQNVKVAYDALNRQTSSLTTYPVSGRSSVVDPARLTSWDGIGRRTAVTDTDLTTTPDYSAAGGVAATTKVAPAKTARVPGPTITATDTAMIDGQTTQRQLAQSGQTTRSGSKLSYDAAGRLTSAADGLGRGTNYTYYDDGQVHTATSPSGTVTTQTFDDAGRLASVGSKTTAGGSNSTTVAYVPAGQPGAGEVASLTDDSGTISYGYDADRNRTKISYPDGSVTTNDYGDNGLLATSTDITGAVTTYAYNTDTSLKSGTQTRAGTTLASVSYTYDSLGRLKTTTRGNGLVTTNSYTPNNLLASLTTVDGNGDQVEAHSYSYDNHHNLTSKTDSTAKPGNCPAICTAGPTTFGTWSTKYGYDVYNRLVSSAVYSGSNTTGQPLTTNAYALDQSGNVTTTTQTTTAGGANPVPSRQLTTDQIDAAGQLIKRTVGANSSSQTYDNDGRVTTALNGDATNYRPDGRVATVSHQGVTTTFSYWADGTRRRSSTADPATGGTDIEFHYSPDGTLMNDTTTHEGGGAQTPGSASASYLLTTGREARTLLPNTTPAGAAAPAAPSPAGPSPAGPSPAASSPAASSPAASSASSQAAGSPSPDIADSSTASPSPADPSTPGQAVGKDKPCKPKPPKSKATPKPCPSEPPTDPDPVPEVPTGVGYLLRDRHSSVTALVDNDGIVTNTYSYGDYGAAALLSGQPGTVVGAQAGTDAGGSNPLQYAGSALHALYTDTAIGTLMTSTRFYDPSQGRFSARDSANVHNRYVGFAANPIMNLDPTGQSPLADFFIDAIYVVLFAIATVATGGAAGAAGAVVFGAEAAVEVTAAATVTFAAQAVATTANVVGLATSATRFADDLDNTVSGKHFLTDDQRSDLSNISTVAGGVAGITGIFSAGAEAATTAAEDAAHAAKPAAPPSDPAPIDTGYDTDELSADSNVSAYDFDSGDEEVESQSQSLSESGSRGRIRLSLDHDDLPHHDLNDLDDAIDASPGKKAATKTRVSSGDLIDRNPQPAAPQPGKSSALRQVWDTLTGKAAKDAAAAAEAESMRKFNAELRSYIDSDKFATARSAADQSVVDTDISSIGD